MSLNKNAAVVTKDHGSEGWTGRHIVTQNTKNLTNYIVLVHLHYFWPIFARKVIITLECFNDGH